MKKIKFKKLGIVLAVVLLVCGLGIGAYYLLHNPVANQLALQSQYNTLTRTTTASKTRGLLDVLHDEYVTSSNHYSENRLVRATATLTKMDTIATNLSQYLTFGTGDETRAEQLADDIDDLLEDRAELIAEVNKAINNLADSTQGELLEGYVRVFKPTAEYVAGYAEFMSELCDYIKTYHYRNNPPAHIAIYTLYFDAVRQCYTNLEPTQVQFKSAYYNSMSTIQDNVTITNGAFDYNSGLVNGQFSTEANTFVQMYYKIGNRYAYAGSFYEYYASRMSTDDTSATAQERATYYLAKVW